MQKFLSDFDEAVGGGYLVEWEYEDGGRYRQHFDTKEEAEQAIHDNEVLNSLNPTSLEEDADLERKMKNA